MWMTHIDPDDFLAIVRPALDSGDADDLAWRVSIRWSPRQMCQLLHSDRSDVRRVACVVLGLVGDLHVVPCLSVLLRDNDEQMPRLAEHALWSIWFRMGNSEAQKVFQRGLRAMVNNQPHVAVKLFHQAHEIDPHFAEAYNQCALAHYEIEQWTEAIADYRRTIQRIATHFGAWAGLGHCHAQLGNLSEAARCYRHALRINPHMAPVAETLERIEKCVSGVTIPQP